MRGRVLKAAGVLLALGAGLGAVLLLRPPCLILKFTGFYCAGCGAQHMVLALLRGDFQEALGQNAFLLVVLPAAVLYALWEAVRYVRKRPPVFRSRGFLPAILVLAAVAAGFTVLRNLPGFSWLAPAWAAG